MERSIMTGTGCNHAGASDGHVAEWLGNGPP
jgi:hypothetical protein